MDQPIPPFLPASGHRILGPEDLDAFVATIDAMGGMGWPAVDALLARVAYAPRTVVDTSLDPFSPEYAAQQLALYSEIAARPLDQTVNEFTWVDVPRHASAPNSYDHGAPAILSEHWLRLSAALRMANPARGQWLLDMGCGWGLSSELMAQAGLNVLAMDVNPKFIELVTQRTKRLGLPIHPALGEFESYTPPHPVDVVLFYECLHHAPRPWFVLARLATFLNRHRGAQFLLAGEPIQSHWWPHWGMRLDAGSIYVMRKFGWFESGWSMEFILRCLAAAGVEPRLGQTDGLGDVIAAGDATGLGLSWLGRLASFDGLTPDGGQACLLAPQASVRFGALPYAATWRLQVHNTGAQDVVLLVDREARTIAPGAGAVDIAVAPHASIAFSRGWPGPHAPLRIEGFQWTSHFD